jgi:hypothetical protein
MSAPTTLAGIATAAVDHAAGLIKALVDDRDDLVILVAYMAAEYFSAQDIAYAVEKPWKYANVLAEAKVALAGVTL